MCSVFCTTCRTVNPQEIEVVEFGLKAVATCKINILTTPYINCMESERL